MSHERTRNGGAIRRRFTSSLGRSRSHQASGRTRLQALNPPCWAVGSNVFAFLGTYHQHGEQKHPFESWLKQLLQHPGEVLSFDDPRHWSERSFVALCMQTTETSIDLYWKDGLLRSRTGQGTPPSVHIPVIEDFVDRVAKKLDSSEGALLTEVINRNASAQFVGGIPDW